MALLGQLTSSSSYDDVAQAIVVAAQQHGYSRDEAVAVLADGIQESGLRPGATSPNGLWVGIYQQDSGYSDRLNPNANISQFLERLDVKRASSGASSDIWLNIFWLQQRPGEVSADLAFAHGRQAYLSEIKSRTVEASRLVVLYWEGDVPVVDKPDFNEYVMWSENSQSRNGVKVDLFLLHTQEGVGNADSLARYLDDPASQVSYHYTVSEDANDHGVTVCDIVDTDYASWSVGDANNRSINLCFAGSFASWSRDEWLANSKALDAAAWLAVQDCRKYGIGFKVMPPGAYGPAPGISDHRYVTDFIGWGSHTDVGPGFPWDYFTGKVNEFAGIDAPPVVEPPTVPVAPPADPVPPAVAPPFVHPSADVMLREVWDQLRGPTGKGWPQLGGKTPVDALGELLNKEGV